LYSSSTCQPFVPLNTPQKTRGQGGLSRANRPVTATNTSLRASTFQISGLGRRIQSRIARGAARTLCRDRSGNMLDRMLRRTEAQISETSRSVKPPDTWMGTCEGFEHTSTTAKAIRIAAIPNMTFLFISAEVNVALAAPVVKVWQASKCKIRVNRKLQSDE